MSLTSERILAKSLFFVQPLWILLIVDVYLLNFGAAIIHVPGVLLMLLINPTWEQMHNYDSWHYLIGDFLFYWAVILTILWVVRRVKRHARDT